MESKAELQEKIRQIEQQISEHQAECERLKAEQEKCEQKIAEIEKEKNTTALLNSIFEITDENALCVYLHQGKRTTPIMDQFYHSDKRYLVFTQAFCLVAVSKLVSLVIVKSRQDVNYDYNGLVMTDLKKVVGGFISELSDDFPQPGDRLYPLYRELIAVGKKDVDKEDIVPFERPCLIGGQTFSDQTGFGSEYYGGDLVYQGKEYGETTKFLIIGAIIGS